MFFLVLSLFSFFFFNSAAKMRAQAEVYFYPFLFVSVSVRGGELLAYQRDAASAKHYIFVQIEINLKLRNWARSSAEDALLALFALYCEFGSSFFVVAVTCFVVCLNML